MSRSTSLAVALTRQGARADMLEALAEDRLSEAKQLLSKKFWTGAAYLVGYCLELNLKAKIARKKFNGYWPPQALAADLHTHDLEILLREAGLLTALLSEPRARTSFGRRWHAVRVWRPSLRYERLKQPRAVEMVDAVGNEPDGVARWLKSHH